MPPREIFDAYGQPLRRPAGFERGLERALETEPTGDCAAVGSSVGYYSETLQEWVDRARALKGRRRA